jgi:polar amino acid transport system substrate-binding protein
MKRRAYAFAALFLALALITAACSSSSDTTSSGSASPGASMAADDLLAQVMSKGELIVASDPKYPPQSELVNGEWQGFDIDVSNEIAKRLGVSTKFITPSWTQITSGNWSGRWDLSVGSMTITTDRAKVLTFTPPYYYTPAGLAVYETNTDITGPADLTGKTVGSCGGCTYQEYLEGTLSIPNYPVDFQITGANVKTYNTDSTAIQDLAKGDCLVLCAVFSAVPTLQNAIDKGQPLKLVGDPLYYEPLAAAVDKAAPVDAASLGAKVSEIITAMHDDGTLAAISCKWYQQDLTANDPSVAADCATLPSPSA